MKLRKLGQWAADGVAVSTTAYNQYTPQIASDGAGGAIITWQEYRSGTDYDIYAQRLNALGSPQWTANGVAVSTAASYQQNPKIISDGAGGAIITWDDNRSGNVDIYAQRLNASGIPLWTANGVAVSTALNYQQYPQITSDGASGAIITWEDYRSGNADIYAQRLNASGIPLWTANGVAVSTAPNSQESPQMASDGAGGAIITWQDLRSNTNFDIYAQRLNTSGVPQWTANGVPVSIAAYDQGYYAEIISDGSGGAIITWQDQRSTNGDIYAQRITSLGNLGADLADTTPPPTPMPQSPANGSSTSATPTFTWTAVVDAPSSPPVYYDLGIDNNSDMLSPEILKSNLATNTYTLTLGEALASGTYYWSVRARDSASPTWNYSSWSTPAWSFIVMPAGPGIIWVPPIAIASITSWAGHSFFQEPPAMGGKLHVAYIDNNSLYYGYSLDGGLIWVTALWTSGGSAGTLYGPIITVDMNGKVFILYGMEANHVMGYDWEYDLYVASNVTGIVVTTLLQGHMAYDNGHDDDLGTANSGPRPLGILVDSMNQVHAFGQHYGWYGYGGATFEWVRTPGPGGTWGARQTVVHIHTPVVDNNTNRYGSFDISTTDKITYFTHNIQDSQEYYVEKTGVWGTATFVATTFPQDNIHFLAYDLMSNLHAAYKVGPDRRTLVYRQNWLPAETVLTSSAGYEVGQGSLDVSSAPKIVYNLLNTSTGKAGEAYMVVRETAGWSPPFQVTSLEPGHQALVPMFPGQHPFDAAPPVGIIYLDSTSPLGYLFFQPLELGPAPSDTTAPATPTPQTPPQGASTGGRPTFQWTEVADAPSSPPVLYDLRIATSSNMASPIREKTNLASNNYTLSGAEALATGTYYWSVRARDSATPAWNYSAWSSPPWSFERVPTAPPPSIAWIRQFGTSNDDKAVSVALDSSGNIYVAGYASAALPGQVHLGGADAFLRKYDASGSVAWTRQFGTSVYDAAVSVSVDSSDNIYVAGSTWGALPGQVHLGDMDAFLRKYDASGSVAWTRQFGTYTTEQFGSSSVDSSGNIYVVGASMGNLGGQVNLGGYDAFLVKYDAAGSVAWTRQFGTSENDWAFSVSVDSSDNIYVAGYASAALPGQVHLGDRDAYIRKYAASGSVAWTRQFGTSEDDRAYSVSVDSSGNVYVAGFSMAALPGQVHLGDRDAYIRKYDAAGSVAWTRQFGTSMEDYARAVARGSAIVAGNTRGAFLDHVNSGMWDAFIRRYESVGAVAWTHQFGTSGDDIALAVATDSSGNIYVAGYTGGTLPNQANQGLDDAFLIKFAPTVPPDTTPPPVPTPQSPANGSSTSATPTFIWTAVVDAPSSPPVYYDLRVATSSAMVSPVINVTDWATNIYTVASAAALSPGTYYWRVRARDSASPPNYSAWTSPPWSFSVSGLLWSIAFTSSYLSEEGVKLDSASAEANAASTTGPYDLADIPDPLDPPSKPYIDIEFLADSETLYLDSRPLSGVPASATWDFGINPYSNVLAGQQRPITLGWSASNVTTAYWLAIQDLASGTYTSLWSNPDYVYNAAINQWRSFKLFARANQSPSVTILFPNGGERVGGVASITALASEPDSGPPFNDGVASVAFQYSANGGATWNNLGPGSLVSGNPASGVWSASWNTSGLEELSTYRIRAMARDRLGRQSSDDSDADFTVSQMLWSVSLSGFTKLFTGVQDEVFLDKVTAAVHMSSLKGVDSNDTEQPPNPPAPALDMYFIIDIMAGTPYSQDYRPPAASIAWGPLAVDLVSNSSADNSRPVTLSWTLKDVPMDYRLFLQNDGDDGLTPATVTVNMRSASSYTYTGSRSVDKYFTIRAVQNRPPAASVIYPNGGTVAGTVQVTAQAFDPDGASPANDFIASVAFYYASSPYIIWYSIGNGALASGSPASGLWAASWNTLPVPEGSGYKVRAIAADSMGAMVMDESDAAFAIIHKITASSTFQEGWNMFSLPLIPDPSDFASQIGDDLATPYRVWNYNNGIKQYVEMSTAGVGTGYWVKASSATPYEVEGFPVPLGGEFDLPIPTGWNQIGHPFLGSISWGVVRVKRGVEIKTMAEAVSAVWMNQNLYWYDTANKVYGQGNPSTGSLNPHTGYWAKALVDGLTLLIPAPS